MLKRKSVCLTGNHQIGDIAAHIAGEHIVILAGALGAGALIAVATRRGGALNLLRGRPSDVNSGAEVPQAESESVSIPEDNNMAILASFFIVLV